MHGDHVRAEAVATSGASMLGAIETLGPYAFKEDGRCVHMCPFDRALVP